MITSAGLGGHGPKQSTIIRRGGRGGGGNNFSTTREGGRGGTGGGFSRIICEEKKIDDRFLLKKFDFY